jgi:mannose-6-phosphate isomerase-like protein (cupin superfamily)
MIRKPWGSEQIIFEAGDARVKLLRVKPGKRLSLQYHEKKDEVMMLVSGRALIKLPGREPFEMNRGDMHLIHAQGYHRLTGSGQSEAVILEMAHGSDADIVRLADDYGRVSNNNQKGDK